MERWFRGAAFEMPDLMKQGRDNYRLSRLIPAYLDESTVTMAWALGFARVRTAMTQLQAQWASPAGKAQLRLHLKKQSDIQTEPRWRFGNLALPAKILDESCQVNFIGLGSLADPLDDFYGAMGEATLKVAVSGIVTRKGTGQLAIDIDELGFYLRESYDFNDRENNFLSQPFGILGASRRPSLRCKCIDSCFSGRNRRNSKQGAWSHLFCAKQRLPKMACIAWSRR